MTTLTATYEVRYDATTEEWDVLTGGELDSTYEDREDAELRIEELREEERQDRLEALRDTIRYALEDCEDEATLKRLAKMLGA